MSLQKISFIFIIVLYSFLCMAQEKTAPYTYWIEFTDKNNNTYSIHNPLQFLSPRAVQRRIKYNIPVTTQDLPVTEMYIDSLKSMGFRIINRSKWFNGVTVHVDDTLLINEIHDISFIKPDLLKTSEKAGSGRYIMKNKTDSLSNFNYGEATTQIEMLNGHLLHELGYTGEGIHVAIMDGGFSGVDVLPAFERLWENNKILGIKDFGKDGANILRNEPHGMYMLSIMGGYLPGMIIGAAPDACYWLLRTEISYGNPYLFEYRVEEDNWVAAAEFADSAGVDVINTSLGYNIFTDSSQNYSVEDLDGKTSRMSVAHTIASSKGMLVATSAGNEGDDPWGYISIPGDADSIFTVGSVDAAEIISANSSRGPAADGRIKPDVCAMGNGTAAQNASGGISHCNGTSCSSPLIAGMAACLWQAHPVLNNMQLYNVIIKSADRYDTPDTIYGYGIPDFYLAHQMITQWEQNTGVDKLQTQIKVYPNPFTSYIHCTIEPEVNEYVQVRITNPAGKLFYSENIIIPGRFDMITMNNLDHLYPGIYYLSLQTHSDVKTIVIFKQP